MDIEQLMQTAVDQRASDLVLTAGNPPVFRIHGNLRRVEAPALGAAEIEALLDRLTSDDEKQRLETEREIDFSVDFEDKARFRVNAFHAYRGLSAVLRVIPATPHDLESLGAPPICRQLAELDKGLVVVTGPAGSGRSNTLAAMLNHINRRFHDRHIVTIERPVEFLLESDRALISHREVGRDTLSYGRALESATRETPNVIMLDRVDDPEILAAAMTAAETGHLVLATMNTSAAARTVDRLIELYPERHRQMVRGQLASCLQGVVAQVLLRRRDGGGRVAAFEVLTGTPAIRNLIREDQLSQIYSMMQMGQRFGMQTMAGSVEALVKRAIVSESEGWRGLLASSGEEDAEGGGPGGPAASGTQELVRISPRGGRHDEGGGEDGGHAGNGQGGGAGAPESGGAPGRGDRARGQGRRGSGGSSYSF